MVNNALFTYNIDLLAGVKPKPLPAPQETSMPARGSSYVRKEHGDPSKRVILLVGEQPGAEAVVRDVYNALDSRLELEFRTATSVAGVTEQLRSGSIDLVVSPREYRGDAVLRAEHVGFLADAAAKRTGKKASTVLLDPTALPEPSSYGVDYVARNLGALTRAVTEYESCRNPKTNGNPVQYAAREKAAEVHHAD